MIGPASNYFIPLDYQRRQEVPHFDDSPFRDEFQREVYELAQYVLMKNKLASVLDLGCGSGYKLMAYLSGYTTRSMGMEVEPTLSWLRRTYPHRAWTDHVDGQYDLVVCSDVIEHVADPDTIIDLIASALPKFVVISTPALEHLERGVMGGPPRNIHHVREWTTEQFRAYIGSRFDVVEQRVTKQGNQVIIAKPITA